MGHCDGIPGITTLNSELLLNRHHANEQFYIVYLKLLKRGCEPLIGIESLLFDVLQGERELMTRRLTGENPLRSLFAYQKVLFTDRFRQKKDDLFV